MSSHKEPEGKAVAERFEPAKGGAEAGAVRTGEPNLESTQLRSGFPEILAVVEVLDLDWPVIEQAAKAPAVLDRMPELVHEVQGRMEEGRGSGLPLLFDDDRDDRHDRAIAVSRVTAPLWFIGDLHGDLLALEAALACIDREAICSSDPPGIVFLGDLFDDGGFGLPVVLRIYELILSPSYRVCLIAGNHDEALGFADGRFISTVSPSDFAELLNDSLSDEPVRQAGLLAIAIFADAPRALFFPDGLLAAHGGFPLADLHTRLAETGSWNDPQVLEDFVWTRAHPTSRKKLPNRYTKGSQFGYEDFAAFCAVSEGLGRPVTHMVRGHDHVEGGFAVYAVDKANPILTTVALSRRLDRESYGPFERLPTLVRYREGAVPQVYRLHLPGSTVKNVYRDEQHAVCP